MFTEDKPAHIGASFLSWNFQQSIPQSEIVLVYLYIASGILNYLIPHCEGVMVRSLNLMFIFSRILNYHSGY